MPFSLSSKRQFRIVSKPRSSRMPAPFRSDTRAPTNATFSTVSRSPRATHVPFPSAEAPPATSRAMPLTPRMVRSFCDHTATSPAYSPASISTTSPERATRLASAIERTSPVFPTRITRLESCGSAFGPAPWAAVASARLAASASILTRDRGAETRASREGDWPPFKFSLASAFSASAPPVNSAANCRRLMCCRFGSRV